MSNDVETLGGVFMIWKSMEKLFLQKLLTRLAVDVPEFQSESFLTELYLLQERLPLDDSDPQVAEQMRTTLKFLGELIETAEEAFAESDRRKQP